jgi:ABC-type multidrug transport system ATPase subunit
MEEVERTADRVIFMKDGQIAAQGTAEELKAGSKAQSLDELYLALTDENGMEGINV